MTFYKIALGLTLTFQYYTAFSASIELLSAEDELLSVEDLAEKKSEIDSFLNANDPGQTVNSNVWKCVTHWDSYELLDPSNCQPSGTCYEVDFKDCTNHVSHGNGDPGVLCCANNGCNSN